MQVIAQIVSVITPEQQEVLNILEKLEARLGRQPKHIDLGIDNGLTEHQVRVAFGGMRPALQELAIYKRSKTIDFTPPEELEDDIPIEEQIEILKKRSAKRLDHAAAQKWMPFKMNSDDPIAICWFGDPHVDDNGCNWDLLGQHIDLVKNTPGMFGANIGDTHNNWVGRLGVLYSHQDTSRETALKLAKWFVQDSGIKWLIWLLGNHDAWNFGGDVMKEITHKIVMKDWQAKFKLVFPNGRECLVDAAHNHKGHSQWNSLHGQQKASTMGGIAHLYIAGHLHNWALNQNECPFTNRIYWLARARGYKFVDDYADKGGFGNQKNGASIVTVIDPTASDVNLVRCFADVAEGAAYLTFLRNRKR